MITKIVSFVKPLQWKAFFFDQDDGCANVDTTKNYDFKSERTPPRHKGLLAFEADLYRLPKNIKFRYVHNQFQTKLAENAKCIKNSEHMFVPADKSANLYKVSTRSFFPIVLQHHTTKLRMTLSWMI